ncbi:hypothetical protein HS088_TW19G00853 [Tripterygium wilfordii]|uniref:F-box domain-containing protein n=1 Tax=Tripterygium wilfordii TaxID=458696 RepID=A0A7J7CBK6_TRIWF|nr:hypothetical protein HS088_TW19G00853 [Tripterygium wilfordii]
MKQNMTITTLHEAIFFNILTWLPAQYLYDSLRYVCSSWASIINNPHFVETLLSRSKFGLMVQKFVSTYGAHFLELESNGVIRISQTWANSQYPGLVLDCSGGLSLLCDIAGSGCYVANFVTKKAVEIPSLPSKPYSIP